MINGYTVLAIIPAHSSRGDVYEGMYIVVLCIPELVDGGIYATGWYCDGDDYWTSGNYDISTYGTALKDAVLRSMPRR